jgi:cell division protease FtsH
MVCEWGMSEKLGPLAYEKREGPVFLGMQYNQRREYSEAKALDIDKEVHRLVTWGHSEAMKIIQNDMQVLHNLAEALLEHETLDGEEINMLVEGAALDDINKRRKELKMASIEAQKEFAEENKIEEDNSGGKDPVGNPGPVTV